MYYNSSKKSAKIYQNSTKNLLEFHIFWTFRKWYGGTFFSCDAKRHLFAFVCSLHLPSSTSRLCFVISPWGVYEFIFHICLSPCSYCLWCLSWAGRNAAEPNANNNVICTLAWFILNKSGLKSFRELSDWTGKRQHHHPINTGWRMSCHISSLKMLNIQLGAPYKSHPIRPVSFD